MLNVNANLQKKQNTNTGTTLCTEMRDKYKQSTAVIGAHLSGLILHLLGFVETVNFIDEHDRLPLAQPELILRLFDHLSDLIGGCAGSRQSDKTSCAILSAGAGNYVS